MCSTRNFDFDYDLEEMKLARIAIFVAIVQAILFLGHWFVYATWIALWPASSVTVLQVIFALLSVSFVAASFLAWRYTHWLVRLFYTIAAVWLGFGNFLLVAGCVCWIVLGAAGLWGMHVHRQSPAAPRTVQRWEEQTSRI